MSKTVESFVAVGRVLDIVSIDRDILVKHDKNYLHILESNALWRIYADWGLVAPFVVWTHELKAVIEAAKYTELGHWSIGKNIEFQSPKTTFTIGSVKTTKFDDIAEVYLKPLLMNSYSCSITNQAFSDAVRAVAPFGPVTSVYFTPTHIKFKAGRTASFNGEVCVRDENHTFPDGWIGHFKTENLVKWSDVLKDDLETFVFLKAAANKPNSPSPLVVENKDSTLSLVLSPLLDLPIF